MNGINRNDTPENIISVTKSNRPEGGQLFLSKKMIGRLPDSYFFLQK